MRKYTGVFVYFCALRGSWARVSRSGAMRFMFTPRQELCREPGYPAVRACNRTYHTHFAKKEGTACIPVRDHFRSCGAASSDLSLAVTCTVMPLLALTTSATAAPLAHRRTLGVLQELVNMQIINPGITKVGGVSGGALVGAAMCSNIPLPNVLAAAQNLTSTCRARADCFGDFYSQVGCWASRGARVRRWWWR
jgi:hypothetical protein